MQLFLLRHGIAEAGEDKRDSDRELTVEGREKIQKIACAMIRMRVQVDKVFSSPLIRALQTANLVAEVCNLDQVDLVDELLPESRPELILSWLEREHPDLESALLVGHEPHMSSLISYMVSGTYNLPIVMKKGGLCRIDWKEGVAELKWLIAPRNMLLLAAARPELLDDTEES